MGDKKPQLEPECAAFYEKAIRLLQANGVPFLLGGAYALFFYTGIERHTKDLDLFLRARDIDKALSLFRGDGYLAEKTFPHWLAKIYSGENFADLIYAAGNGLCEVDDSWFVHAREEELLGLPVRIMAPEEMIWMKAFVQERERYDGADVAHLILSCASSIDWQHLVRRFGDEWPVLFSHLVLFDYVYPSERHHVPAGLISSLAERLVQEHDAPIEDPVCRGTLLSRAQYLPDVSDRGYRDARLEPRTNMTSKDVVEWTAAIDPRDRASAADTSD